MKESFILKLFEDIFNKLEDKTIYRRIEKHFIEKSGKEILPYIVDKWVLGNTIASMTLWLIAPWSSFLSYYGFYRMYEMSVYHISHFIFDKSGDNPDDEKKNEKPNISNGQRWVIIAILNYFEVVFWFAAIYNDYSTHFISEFISLSTRFGSLYYSLVTMATVGYGDITPKDNIGALICSMQILFGLFLTVMVISRVVGLLPELKDRK